MTTSRTADSVSRRTALAGLGAGGLGLALAGRGLGASARQDAPVDHSAHPLAGTWLAMANPPLPESPQFAAPSYFGADGSVLLVFPLTQLGPQGTVFNSPVVGTWEPDTDRRGHFTAVQVLSAADGTYVGTTTIDGYPEVSEDGQTFVDDGSRVVITIRDAAGAVVQEVAGLEGGRPVTAIRMGPGQPGFPTGDDAAATPAP